MNATVKADYSAQETTPASIYVQGYFKTPQNVFNCDFTLCNIGDKRNVNLSSICLIRYGNLALSLNCTHLHLNH